MSDFILQVGENNNINVSGNCTFHIRKNLKDLGAKYDGKTKSWSVSSDKITQLISLIEQFRKLNLKLDRESNNYVLSGKCTYVIRSKIKQYGGIWNNVKKQWTFDPDKVQDIDIFQDLQPTLDSKL